MIEPRVKPTCWKHGKELPCQDCFFNKVLAEAGTPAEGSWTTYWENKWRTECILRGLKE